MKITINGTASNSNMFVFAGGQEGSPVEGNAHVAINGGDLEGIFFHGVRLNDKTIKGDATIEINGGKINQLGAVYNLNSQSSNNKASVDGKASIIIKGMDAEITSYVSYYKKSADIFPYSLIFKDYGTDSRPATLRWDIPMASEVVADNSYIIPSDKSFIFAAEHGLTLMGKTWVLPEGKTFTIKSYNDEVVDLHQEVLKTDDWEAEDFTYLNEQQKGGSFYKVGNSIRYGSDDVTFHEVTIEEPAEEDKEKGTLSVVWDGTEVKSGDRVPKVDDKKLVATLTAALGYNATLYINDQPQTNLKVETVCNNDMKFSASWDAKSYAVQYTQPQNGILKVTTAEGQDLTEGKAAYTSTCKVIVTPNVGYQLVEGTLKVTYSSGAEEETVELTPVEGQLGVYTFKMPAGDVTITASFEEKHYTIQYTQPQNGILKVTTAEGQDLTEGKAAYTSTCKVIVTPNVGYQLVEGTLKVTYSSDAEEETVELTPVEGQLGVYIFKMPAGDVTITASFEEKHYTIQYTQPQNGILKVTTAEGQDLTEGKAAYTSTCKVIVIPNVGYQLVEGTLKVTYLADGLVTQEPKEVELIAVEDQPGTYTFTMPAGNVSIVAQMGMVDYKIIINQPDGGTISASKSVGHLGDLVKLSYKRDTYYYFERWMVQTVSGQEIEVSEENTFEMPAEEVVITALFSYNPPYEPSYYSLSFEKNDSVSFTADRTQVKEGGSFTFTADVAAGYDPSTLIVEYRTGYYSSWKSLKPKNDGSYQIRSVYNNIYVRARVDRLDDPTANESLSDSMTSIRIHGRMAYITTAKSAVMHIVSLSGQVVRVVQLRAGNNEVSELPQGYLLLVIEKDICKKILIH